MAKELEAFVRESNRIEGILRDPTPAEIEATAHFIYEAEPSVEAMEALVAVYAPGMPLRRQRGMNVRVGSHVVPPGGPARWFIPGRYRCGHGQEKGTQAQAHGRRRQ